MCSKIIRQNTVITEWFGGEGGERNKAKMGRQKTLDLLLITPFLQLSGTCTNAVSFFFHNVNICDVFFITRIKYFMKILKTAQGKGVSSKLWANLGTWPGMSLVSSHLRLFSTLKAHLIGSTHKLPTDYVIIMVCANKSLRWLFQGNLWSQKTSLGFEALPITCPSAGCHLPSAAPITAGLSVEGTGGLACRPLQTVSWSWSEIANYS